MQVRLTKLPGNSKFNEVTRISLVAWRENEGNFYLTRNKININKNTLHKMADFDLFINSRVKKGSQVKDSSFKVLELLFLLFVLQLLAQILSLLLFLLLLLFPLVSELWS